MLKQPCLSNKENKCCQILDNTVKNAKKVMTLMKYSLESTDPLTSHVKQDQLRLSEKLYQYFNVNQSAELTSNRNILTGWR